jgi:hypothetical protein
MPRLGDNELVARLRAVYLAAIEDAQLDVPTVVRPIILAHRRLALAQGVPLVFIAIGVVVTLWVAQSWIPNASRNPTNGSNVGVTTASSTPTAAASEPTPPPTVMPTTSETPAPTLPGGIPVSIDGEPVLTIDQAITADAISVDAGSILIGGWLHGERFACWAQTSPWDGCAALFLYAGPLERASMSVFHTASRPAIPKVPLGQAAAVVIEAHTHDPWCDTSRYDCLLLPVIDSVVWVGGSETPSLEPGVTPPPGGTSRDTAGSVAADFLATNGAEAVSLRSASAERYGETGVGGAAIEPDRWVWVLVFDGSFRAFGCETSPPCPSPAKSALVVIDYLRGTLIEGVIPAP